MTYIKKLVMHGFKSFAPKTEVIFDKGINIVIGPNGSGKSNISDALCFALGRLSIKSMRAAKAKNLIFMGSKYAKPAKEASVEIFFDNSKNIFQTNKKELVLKRIVRRNGQSIYKIDGQTRTRTEVIEILAHAGIDPHGFNLVLQGQIQSIVKMHPDERRKIIEEVAGISIYELRKEKSLKELTKTEQRLKEILTVLKERTAYLRNLEKERSQALRYTELQNTIKRAKASILDKKIKEKEKELSSIHKSIESKTHQKDKAKQNLQDHETLIEKLNEKILQINKHIQRSTGVEQETLRTQIANLRAEMEGLKVRKENFQNRRNEIEHRIEEMKKSIPQHETEIKDLKKESPLVAKKQEELQKKKLELKEIEEEKKKIYTLKTEIESIKDRIKDRESQITRISSESDDVLREIEESSIELEHTTSELCKNDLSSIKGKLITTKKDLEELSLKEIQNAKIITAAETTIDAAEKTKGKVQKIDICPLCKSKMTKEHLGHVIQDSNDRIKSSKKYQSEALEILEKIKEQKSELNSKTALLTSRASKLERELLTHRLISEKKTQLNNLIDQENFLKSELKSLGSKRDMLQSKSFDASRVDEKYSAKMMEIEEISARTAEDLDQTLMYKERELEKIKEIVKSSHRDLNEMESEISELRTALESKSTLLKKRETQDKALSEKFKKLFQERDSIQEKIQKESYALSNTQNEHRQIEDQINYLKIGNAKISAEKEALEMEANEFAGAEIIKGTLDHIQERLQKAQNAINSIGPINMRALEVYEEVKKEYDKVYEKVETLEKEKEEIIKIIEEIDKRKKRAFMKTFRGLNDLFSSNFANLFSKGQAFLEIENPKDIFEGGINIVVKFARGKSFDVTSLSGGEQTLIALSLLFAIQEYRPYHFYIFDEIDAALDKRNSERLSALIKKYIKQGQYIIVTHNEALMLDSDTLYGVSMHEGISKVLTLNVGS